MSMYRSDLHSCPKTAQIPLSKDLETHISTPLQPSTLHSIPTKTDPKHSNSLFTRSRKYIFLTYTTTVSKKKNVSSISWPQKSGFIYYDREKNSWAEMVPEKSWGSEEDEGVIKTRLRIFFDSRYQSNSILPHLKSTHHTHHFNNCQSPYSVDTLYILQSRPSGVRGENYLKLCVEYMRLR